MSTTLEIPHARAAGPAPPPRSVPRLLAGVRATHGRMDLAAHVRWYGPAPRLRRGELAELVEQAGLTGRGGAGFPTSRKLRSVGAGRKTPLVVVNAMEGEPQSRKDGYLLEHAPQLVLDGALLAARDVNADEVLVALARDRGHALISTQRAAAERRNGRSKDIGVEVHAGPPRYVGGEETALVHWLNGGPMRPLATPPRPFERGVDGRPTLILNAETAAHLALIARYGPAWFRQIGTPETPGTALVTVAGDVLQQRVVEVRIGTPLPAIVEACDPRSAPAAVLAGGFFGGWIPWELAARTTADPASLRSVGAGLGPGILTVVGGGTCVIAETARIVRYLAAESAGQCGPCVHGVAAVAADLTGLAVKGEGATALQRLRRRLDLIDGRGACALPDGVRRLGRSVLLNFEEHVDEHVRHGACRAAHDAQLILPTGPRSEADWR